MSGKRLACKLEIVYSLFSEAVGAAGFSGMGHLDGLDEKGRGNNEC